MTEEKPKIHIEGFGIAGYKSFGPEIQWAYPFGKVNVFIGPNNAGKSNLLLFIAEKYAYAVGKSQNPNEAPFFEEDLHRADGAVGQIFLPLRLHCRKAIRDNKIRSDMDLFVRRLNPPDSPFFIPFQNHGEGSRIAHELINEIQNMSLHLDVWRGFSAELTTVSHPSVDENIQGTLRTLIDWTVLNKIDKPILLPAKRELNRAPNSLDYRLQNCTEYVDGQDLIAKLGHLEKPDVKTIKEDQSRFLQLQEFVREVLDDKTAKLEVPKKAEYLIIESAGKHWKLQELGTGIHEVIVIAAAAIIYTNRVICLEEPELHLHPLLQKRLISYLLRTDTQNQYFITTHSAHVMNCDGVNVFRIEKGEQGSIIRAIASESDKMAICDSLGYSPSDLLQSNYIIWVEGPSDRIYLRHWLSHWDSSLIEGIHYSILFYGGRILSHFTGASDDDATEDLIKTRKINQRGGVFIDSDKNEETEGINKTKTRVFDEFSKDSFAWVTAGRESENYYSQQDIEAALKVVHPDTDIEIKNEKTFEATKTKPERTIQLTEIFRDFVPKGVDKVKLAQHLVKEDIAPRQDLDFDPKMKELVAFIWKANGKEIKSESSHCEACKQPKPALASK